MRCHRHNGNVSGLLPANFSSGLEPVHHRHLAVHQHDVITVLSDRFHGFQAVLRHVNLIAENLKHLFAHISIHVIVVDQKNPHLTLYHSGAGILMTLLLNRPADSRPKSSEVDGPVQSRTAFTSQADRLPVLKKAAIDDLGVQQSDGLGGQSGQHLKRMIRVCGKLCGETPGGELLGQTPQSTGSTLYQNSATRIAERL